MLKHIIALVFIFFCATFAWFVLGLITESRTYSQERDLKKVVGELWGSEQNQQAPSIFYTTKESRKVQSIEDNKVTEKIEYEYIKHVLKLDKSDINVDIKLTPRKKGLLWYPTYSIDFAGEYLVSNPGDKKNITFSYTFPTENGVYDNFIIYVNDKEVKDTDPVNGQINVDTVFNKDESKVIKVIYKTQGMEKWWYSFGEYISQVKNFTLNMTTNFDKIDFPDKSISPTDKVKTKDGWKLTWKYKNLISGIQIGMDMPQKLNPGPFVSKVTFFAPVSLFLFMFLVFVISTVKKIKIHPMNYFFIACAFFSFHLLMAYLADHVDINVAFMISSVVSIFLVISYMRLVVGIKYACIEIGLSQLIYLILFSYAFFLEGFTGLAITICCILTLFVVMQFTGKVNWEELFKVKV
ncbi:MAG: inner membrane CreD family protein [Vampirovibrionia bacterium]